jgi:hypothetical protein
MLTQYKNIEQINSANKAVTAQRISKSKTEFFSYDKDTRVTQVPLITTQDPLTKIELHVYSGDTWITGNHNVQIQQKTNSAVNKQTKFPIQTVGNSVSIDVYNEFSKLKLTSGNFRIAVNFFKNLIGNYNEQYLRIEEISPDRTEIRLKAIDDENPIFLQQIVNFIDTVNPTTGQFYKTYILNFSRNKTAVIVNTTVIGEYVYLKLYEPLSDEIDVDFKCWIVEELRPSYIDKVAILPKVTTPQYNKLSNPNWYANAIYNTTTETGFKAWTDLLSTTTQTSQQIVDAYFSGSLAGVKLNIDYSDFNNFVFYSSAKERLENFKYKVQLLEYYTSQSLAVSQISGSVATTNVADFNTAKSTLIGGFDDFERYLYYESSSRLTTYDIPNENAYVTQLTGSYVAPAPKTTSSIPYMIASTTSSLFINWFDGLYSSASLYDSLNYNALRYAIPEFIRFDATNTDMLTFVDMLGQHYDILYTYINHMSRINKREENPKLGMPNELLYSVAKQFGWNLTDGNQGQELWQYVLGTNESGAPLTGSNSIGDPSVPGKNMTATIWRRIVNNLPLLLKSKGTKRSIQALLSCYGIPQSFISINEYGGPRLERAPVYEKLNFDYALDLIGSAAGNVVVNYNKPIQSVELRFRTADVIKNPTLPSTMNLYNIGSNSVTIDFSSGTLGVIQINGTGSAAFELFNGDWINTVLRVNGTNLDLIAKKSKYGKIVTTVSASATASFATTGSLTLGGTSTGASRLVGQIQELRLWTSSLQNSPFENHTKAPAAYDANIDAYNELVFRLPLTQKINHSTTSSIYGVQPASSSISASFTSWTNNTPYDSIEETYYYDAISLGAGTLDDNKIRLEENELVGTLDIATRAERSQFDKAPLDSKKLGVYFSPQTMINEDIIAQLGFTELDQYIGDPGQLDSKSYPELVQTAQMYWKKYESKNDINSYISMFTLYDLSFFRQLEQLLPARTDKLTGLLIQPNILERSKDTILPKIHRFNSTYTSSIDETKITANGSYLIYNASISDDILTIQGIDDDQWQMYLTASTSDKYDGTPYSFEYLLRSGSTWITGSSPYWLSDALQPSYVNAVSSEYRLTSESVSFQSGSAGAGTTYGTGTYGSSFYYSDPTGSGFTGVLAQVQDYLPIGIDRQRYDGTKMTSPAFNVNSTQTVDGGPVVEWRTANPNQLIYQTQNNNQGSFRLV